MVTKNILKTKQPVENLKQKKHRHINDSMTTIHLLVFFLSDFHLCHLLLLLIYNMLSAMPLMPLEKKMILPPEKVALLAIQYSYFVEEIK